MLFSATPRGRRFIIMFSMLLGMPPFPEAKPFPLGCCSDRPLLCAPSTAGAPPGSLPPPAPLGAAFPFPLITAGWRAEVAPLLGWMAGLAPVTDPRRLSPFLVFVFTGCSLNSALPALGRIVGQRFRAGERMPPTGWRGLSFTKMKVSSGFF